MAVENAIRRALKVWHSDGHYGRSDMIVPYDHKYHPTFRLPSNQAEWEAFAWYQPPIIDGAFMRNHIASGYSTRADYEPAYPWSTYSFRPLKPDTRPNVLPKPTWLELMAKAIEVSEPEEFNPIFASTREERHQIWQGVVSKAVFGSKHHDNEHYIRERSVLTENHKRSLQHARHRFHEIDILIDRIISGVELLQPQFIEAVCAWQIDDLKNLEGLAWQAPWKDKPFDLHHQIQSFDDPEPDAPPTWDPIIQRTGVEGARVTFQVDVPVPATIRASRLQAYHTNGTRFSTVFRNQPGPFLFYIDLPNPDTEQEADFGWVLRPNGTSGSKRFLVSTRRSPKG